MKQTAKILFLLHCALCTVFLPVKADEAVEFRAQAPAQVIVGKPFQLTYTINQRARDLKAPQMADFEVLAGPYTSTSSSTSFVNGKRTSTYTQTYTYTLLAQREGTFTIPPADIKVSGERYQSNGVRITVLSPDEQPAAGTSQGGNAQQSRPSQQSASDGSITSENLFIRTILSKTRVHEQEAILLSYKLYFTGVDVAQFTNNTKIPEFTGFLKQAIEQGIENPEVAELFAPEWNVFNECTILTTNSQGRTTEYRPDRVVSNDKETRVVDFKFGHPRPEHAEQVKGYMQLLQSMNYPNVSGMLWYVKDNWLEKVNLR